MSLIGKINEFNIEEDDWTVYIERLEQYYEANDTKEDKKRPILLSTMGNTCYELLRNLCAPSKPKEKTYSELVQILTTHLQPAPSAIAQRYKFRQRRQGLSETIFQYVAVLKKLSMSCKFNTNLSENLRDQLVWGVHSETIKQRLLAESDELTFDNAVKLASSLETAEKDAMNMDHPETSVNQIRKRNVMSNTNSVCKSCGRRNHASTDCRFRSARCYSCGLSGHLASVCRKVSVSSDENKRFNYKIKNKRQSQNNYVSLSGGSDASDTDNAIENFYMTLNKIDCKDSQPMFIKLYVNSKKMKFEIDTGSPISIINDRMYQHYFETEKLEKSRIKLKSYTGQNILSIGYINVDVEYKGSKKKLQLQVVENGGPPLVGRDWIRRLGITDYSQCNFIKESTQPKSLNKLLAKYKDIFSEETGIFNKGTAKLYLKENSSPVFFRARPLPFAIQNKVNLELDRLMSEGKISPVEFSNWASPIVPVLKKDGTVRICGDFKVTINPVLKVDMHPLPRINDILAKLSGGQLFCKLDLKNAYLQIPIAEDSKELVTINTHKGLFRYNYLPYGVSSSPGIFQRYMDQLFSKLPGVFVFMDDILVTGRTYIDILNNLKSVLEVLKNSGLKVKSEKCEWMKSSIEYLGYVIDKNGLHTDQRKVDAIKNCKTPSNVKELQTFLGLVNYYGKFIPNLSTKLAPLYKLLRKNINWRWDKECAEAFKIIKLDLMSNKILAHFDDSLPIILSCDASPVGIGAVISHKMKNNDIRPIAYASRSLNDSERNYSQLDREALSLIFGLKKFHQFLWGREFELQTDNKPLAYILKPNKGISSMTASRLQRWSIFLAGYSFKVKHVKSSDNVEADMLSRLPLSTKRKIKNEFTFLNFIESSFPITSQEIKKETRKDNILSQIYNYVEQGWPESVEIEQFKPYFSRKDELYIEDGCLMWGYRVIVPLKLRAQVLQELHEPHFGIVKTKEIARSYVWWPLLDKEVEILCHNCDTCVKEQNSPERSQLHPWSWPNKPWYRVHADFCYLNNRTFLIVTDSYTKWIEAFQVNKTTAENIISILMQIFSRFGLCNLFVSDNGPPFTSNQFKMFLQKNGIRQTFSAPYHPSSNGAAENSVKNFKIAIKKYVNNNINLERAIHKYLYYYRNTVHSTTGCSPASLMFGRHLRTNFDQLKPNVENKVIRNQERQVKNSGGKDRTFENNNKVLVREYSNPSHPKWIAADIISRTGPVSYVVESASGAKLKRHVDQIKKDGRSLVLPVSKDNDNTDIALLGDRVSLNHENVDNSSFNELELSTISNTENVNMNSQRDCNINNNESDQPAFGIGKRYPTRVRKPPERFV